jgi:AAA+ ATPase superfamily predicted ATPase
MFVNRSSELDALERWWARGNGALAIVWGRRRVGKTALVRRFAEGRHHVFHTGAGRSTPSELRLLMRQVLPYRERSLRDLATRPYSDWDDALDHLGEVAADEPLLLVLDEFPELAGSSPELPNLLRAFLDRAQGRTKLRILLCGSAVRYMSGLAEERQPLYGRMSLSLHLHPFTPWEAALMLPRLSPSERAEVYGIVGGTPLYLSWWDQDRSIEDNVRELACQPGGRLLTEGELVLATEAEAGEQPRMVLHAIAAGCTRHHEIKDAIQAEPTRTIERLTSLRLVEQMRPVTETERTRRRLYRIADNFLAFYLGVLTKYRTEIEAGLGRSILPVLMEGLEAQQGQPWEAAFRSHLRRLAARGDLGEKIVAIGPFWTTDGQNEIDAVALAGRSRTPVLAGEAKWARKVDARRLAADLHRKATALPGAPGDIQLALCAREAVEHATPEIRVVTAQEIFSP